MVNGIISTPSTNNVIKLQASGYSIMTDKIQYNYGEIIIWKAEGLIVGKKYVVGVYSFKSGLFYWLPLRDEFIASETTKTGRYYVGTNLPPGDAEFWLNEKSDGEFFAVATIPIKIGGGDSTTGGGVSIIASLMQNWWLIAIIGFILLIIFLLKR
jgi:hypothetical protein